MSSSVPDYSHTVGDARKRLLEQQPDESPEASPNVVLGED